MEREFVVLTARDSFGIVYKIYSADLKNYYGDFYSESEVCNKLSALYQVMSKRMVAWCFLNQNIKN